jgi:carbamoyltransferase
MTNSQLVLGISMSNHDRAACLLRDGEIVAAVAEERLDRRKASEGFYRFRPRQIVLPPLRAITAVLRESGVSLNDLDLVVCGRSITTCRDELLAQLPLPADRVVEPPTPAHHIAHAYASFATAPFEDSAVLIVDEQGQLLSDGHYEKISWYQSDAGRLRAIAGFTGTDTDLSLGMFYNVFAALIGLSEAGRPAAGKLMALGSSVDASETGLIDLHPDGDISIPLDRLDRFLQRAGLPRTGAGKGSLENPDDLLARYQPISWQTGVARELAAVAEHELRRALLHTASALRQRSAHQDLAIGGGVALNCTTNACLQQLGWRDIFAHPAATDDGNAVGLAYYGWAEVLGGRRRGPRRFLPYLGPRYTAQRRVAALEDYGLDEFTTTGSPAAVAEQLAQGRVACWFHGRSEWGPRALGGRSIVADPRAAGMKRRINESIKHREPFRPFGISVLDSAAENLLDLDGLAPSLLPYMLAVARFRDRSLPEVTHDDGTVRPQVVHRDDNPQWWELIRSFGELTGLPAVLNTSFNTFGEPLVESPEDAVRQFLLADADLLYLDGLLLDRALVPAAALHAARRTAVARSRLDVGRLALAIEAAGYPQIAVALLDRLNVTTGGRDVEALRMRAAALSGDDDAARRYARAVISTLSVPSEISAAISLLTTTGNAEGIGAMLLAALAGDVDVTQFWSGLLTSSGAAS